MLFRGKKLLCVLLILNMLWMGSGTALARSMQEKPATAGAESWAQGKYDVLSIPTASFRPASEDNEYLNTGHALGQTDAASDTGTYYAPVNLPNGATVTKMTFYFRDNAAGNGDLRFYRAALDGAAMLMAAVSSAGSWVSPFYGTASTTAITEAQIDNSRNVYYLEWELPDSDSNIDPTTMVWGCGVTIEYYNPTLISIYQNLSLSPAAFTPTDGGYSYLNAGAVLQHFQDTNLGAQNGYYSGQVSLPNGATITKIQFYYAMNTNTQGFARLQRSDPTDGSITDLASIETGTGKVSATSALDDSINEGTINNDRYTYWVMLEIPARNEENSNLWVYGVVISYAYLPASPKEGAASISGASFIPYQNGYGYQNASRYLVHLLGTQENPTRGWYLAPLHLPDGVHISSVKFHWYDNSALNYAYGYVKRLRVGAEEPDAQILASVSSISDQELIYLSNETGELASPVIDNVHYTYWLAIDLPASTGALHLSEGDVAILGVAIQYTYHPIFIPTLLKGPPQ